MDLRTLLAALRRRHQGQDAPDTDELWGYGHYLHHIRNNWTAPYFKLEHRYPYVIDIVSLLESGNSLQLEQHLLQTVWNYYTRCIPEHPYGFPAVFLYCARWDVVDRWRANNSEKARQVFNQLLDDSLEDAQEQLALWT